MKKTLFTLVLGMLFVLSGCKTSTEGIREEFCSVFGMKPDEYPPAWYKEDGIKLPVSEEDMEHVLQGYRRVEAMGFEVVVSDTVQPVQEVLFYENLNFVPEEILLKYIDSDEVYELDEPEARKYQSLRVTKELAERTAKGMQKAEEAGISLAVDGATDILSVMNAYATIYGAEKDVFTFVTTYGDNMTGPEKVEVLGLLEENRTAQDGYVRLKMLGIAVEIAGNVSAEDILYWFESVDKIPEELVQIYVNNNWDVVVPEGGLRAYGEENKSIMEDRIAERAVNGYRMAENMGIVITFEERMSFFELAVFLGNLSDFPEEVLQRCAEEDVDLCASSTDFCRDTNSNPEVWDDVMKSYQRLEKMGLNVDFGKEVSLFTLVEFYRAMADIPEEFINIYVGNGWKVPLSSEKRSVYEDALNYMDDTIYEKARKGYGKIQKHKMRVNYLDIWQPTELIMFFVAIDSIPEYILKDFAIQGWTLNLSDASLKIKYDMYMDMAGVTSFADKTVEVVSCDNVRYIDETVIHEMGHYVDFSDWDVTGMLYSEENRVFRKWYRKIKREENDGKEWEYDSDDILKDITNIYYRPYSFTTGGEFFADSFYFYIAYPDELKEKYPEVYDYLDKCTKSLQ